MPFATGHRIGNFEIVSPLGSGGMGEVYRARDLRLDRDVALKILPAEFASDPQRLVRFAREAKMLAALSHPNIAAIHDVGLEHVDEQPRYIIMELVEGETLESRLERGPLTVAESLNVFRQVASALEAAHEQGIIHRDLKPANIQLSAGGGVKVLDFGLAKPVVSMTRPHDDKKKTQTFDQLSQGLILGTPTYMSPEQARALPVGRQSDVWSLGCCLYEALTGVVPFDGETISDVLAAVLSHEPDYAALPKETPLAVERLVRKSLRKDRHRRLQDLGDVRIELEDAAVSSVVEPGVVSASSETLTGLVAPGNSGWAWALAAASGILLLISVWSPWRGRAIDSSRDVAAASERDSLRRFVVGLPPTAPMSVEHGAPIAFSPDGERFAYASTGEQAQIFVRNLGELTPVAVAGTRGGSQPFFSPNGQWMGFHAGGKLLKIAIAGGAPIELAESPSPRGAVWLPNDSIVFAPRPLGGLRRVPASGGSTQALTSPDDEGIGDRWPAFIGEWVIFSRWANGAPSIEAIELDGSSLHHVLDDAGFPKRAGEGHLLFVRDGDLYATRYDSRRAESHGEPLLLFESVSPGNLGVLPGDLSVRGDLVYARLDAASTRPASSAQMLWVDSKGNIERLGQEIRGFQLPRLAPDARSLVVTIQNSQQTDIWTWNLERGGLARLTTDGASGAAIWAPDGRSIAYSSDSDGAFNIYRRAADGTGAPTRILRSENPQFPSDISPDGSTMLVIELDPENGFDVLSVDLGSTQLTPMFETRFNESSAVYSTDGDYVAYVSDESGRNEVYLRGVSREGKWQVSTQGGSEPRFSVDGGSLFFRGGGELYSVSIVVDGEPSLGEPRLLFEAPFDEAGVAVANYDVAPDGRFLMVRTESGASVPELLLDLNYLGEIRRRLPPR